MIIKIINYLNWAILWYFIFLSLGYIVLLIASVPDLYRRYQEYQLGRIIELTQSNSMPPVTAIVPAYNEENNISDTIDSLLKSSYANTHIIVVNADSTDRTLEKLITELQLHKATLLSPEILWPEIKLIGRIKDFYFSKIYPNITVIDKENRERSDAINAGLKACHTPLFITIDADTIIEKNAISRIVFYMLSRPNTIAVGGTVYILNGCSYNEGEITRIKLPLNLIYGFQVCEYLRSFLFSRTGWNALGGALGYAGAFTLLQHKDVIDIGGYDLYNPAQDFEIITHLHAYNIEQKNKYHIGFTPSAAVWTDVPGTFKEYWRQRTNWQEGTLKSLMRFKRMLFNPKYKTIGLYSYPFFLFGEALSCIVEFLAYASVCVSWLLGILNVKWAILFFILCLGFSTFLTVISALMNFVTFNKYKNLSFVFWMLFLALIEPFGFRQYNVICRVLATIKFFFKKNSH